MSQWQVWQTTRVFCWGEAIALTQVGRLAWPCRTSADTKLWGTHWLTAAESAKLWELVGALGLHHLPSSTRPPVPDEVALTISLRDQSGASTVQIWANDAFENPSIRSFAGQVGVLIEKYTGQLAVLC